MSTTMFVPPDQLTLERESDRWPDPEAPGEYPPMLPPLENPTMPLHVARAILLEHVDEGTVCDCCARTAKRYARQVNVEMALTLIALYRLHGRDWGNLKDVRREAGTSNREESKLRYWGLVEEESYVRREDGGRAGWWRVTARGERYVLGHLAIPKYALEWDRRCVGHQGELVTIKDALDTKFDLAELLAR